jgi:hypothetical protein
MNKGEWMMDGSAQTAVDGDAGQNLSGRARVRRVLVAPLVGDGLERQPKVSVTEHAAFLEKLVDRLSYLDEAALRVVAECTLRLADGPRHNRWPSFATIWGVAQRVCRQPEPDEARHIMTTWLRSIEGPIAQAGGYLVELHGWLRKHGIPPRDYDMRQIRAGADENARTLARLQARIDRGEAAPSDVDWVTGYLRSRAYCEALVAGGAAVRAEKHDAGLANGVAA